MKKSVFFEGYRMEVDGKLCDGTFISKTFNVVELLIDADGMHTLVTDIKLNGYPLTFEFKDRSEIRKFAQTKFKIFSNDSTSLVLSLENVDNSYLTRMKRLGRSYLRN